MIVTSTAPRRHHTELRPLTMRPDTPVITGRRRSSQGFGNSVTANPTLPSPSVVAARAYFYDINTAPIRADGNAIQRRGISNEEPFPRRHSVLATPGSLARQLESFQFTPRTHELSTVDESEEVTTRVKSIGSGDISMPDVDREESTDSMSTSSADRKSSSSVPPTPQEVLRQVPFRYTHERLRDWGYAYLGNMSTADAYVNAVSLRRSSMTPPSPPQDDDNFQVKRLPSPMVTIRARVVPKAKERKAFLIQRRFDLDELRRTIPDVQQKREDADANTSSKLRRSTRLRRPSVQPVAPEHQGKGSLDCGMARRISPLGKSPVPVHIEYALHFLPVLAALMLSGHVRKGDSIDLPLPHPAAWREVIAYIYTGRGHLTPAMRENILYLAGHA